MTIQHQLSLAAKTEFCIKISVAHATTGDFWSLWTCKALKSTIHNKGGRSSNKTVTSVSVTFFITLRLRHIKRHSSIRHEYVQLRVVRWSGQEPRATITQLTVGIRISNILSWRQLKFLATIISSQAFSSRYFSWTSGDPHHSSFKLHTAVISVLCVMFQV